jgi:EAL domain-containing protein (putative c-di-GMP-specific phosphodiesterase class I)
MGVPVADGFLVEAADRLQRLMGPETLLARTGDKELALCVCDSELPEPEAFTSRILSVLEDRFAVGRQAIYSPALIGIAQCFDGYGHGPELVAQASLAATTCASSGNRWSIFAPETKEERIGVLQLEADLQSAIHNDELILKFQPIVSMQSGSVVGFESLLRWRHPTGSWIEPERFIPLAESLGLMSRISERVAAEGVAHAKRWQPLRQTPPLYVTVNLTPRDLSRDFCNRIFDLLAQSDLAPECLRVEITETALVQDFGLAARLIGELNERGVRVLLDDFGTGYSSLSYLRDLPFHAVKIDKSFVQLMTSDARDFGLVRSIVSLVQYLGMECVAEGVETQEQLDLIGMVNCDFWQGFLFSPPVAASEVEALVHSRPATAAAMQAAG